MRYLGGKNKIRRGVAAFLESVRRDGQVYFEPFVGGGWVLQEMSGKRIASDVHKALISMYQALQAGWEPPEFVSEAEYANIKILADDSDPMTAFCGFGLSFAGKWFGGYARSKDKDCYAGTTKRSLLAQRPKLAGTRWLQGDYTRYSPVGMLIYCDPPYAGTTSYKGTHTFDTEQFWSVMRDWSRKNTVVVSEYAAPDDFKCVCEFRSQMGMTCKGVRPQRAEKLFMRGGR